MTRRTPRCPGIGVSLGLIGLAAWAAPVASQIAEPPTPERAAPGGAGPGDVVLDVPYVAQTEALCGGAAVTMALRYWGDARTLPERFESVLTPDGSGILTHDLRAATAGLGWQALALTGDLTTVERQLARGRPLIALIEVGPARHHYVTVVGRVGGRVVYHDPAVSPYRTMSDEAFLAAWAGGGRWAMLVLPRSGTPPLGPGPAGGSAPDRAGPDQEEADGPVASRERDSNCAATVDRAVRLARGGALDEAERLLRSANAACPADAVALREMAALRLRRGRPAEAAGLARASVERDPADNHAREILAASHFLTGKDVAALAEWNRIEPVVLGEVTLGAPTRTRNAPILALAGLEHGRPLSAERLAVGRKRLALLPAASSTRLAYRPLPNGRVAATASVAERPAVPSPIRLLAELGLGLVTERGIRVRSASPTGHGELWSFDWRWREPRRRVAVAVALPIAGPIPAVLTFGGAAERETYRFGGEVPELREERRRAGVEASTWTTSWLRVSAGAAFDRWRDAGAYGSVAASTRLSGLDDRLGLTLGGELWIGLGEDRRFARARAEMDWVSSRDRRGFVAAARLGARSATAAAPRSVWPGAGAGPGREARARGHDLLIDGRITGPLFGRRLLHGGFEVVRWAGAGPIDVGLAGFVDLAAAGARPVGIVGGSFQTDAGIGLRLGLPGGDAIRLDVGRGLLDGEMAVSAGLALADGTGR